MNTVKKMPVLIVFIMSIVAFYAAAESNQAQHFSIQTLDGSHFNLSDFKGKKAVHLVFWATWCPSCRREIPKLKEVQKKYGNDMALLTINIAMDDPLHDVRHYVKEHNIDYAVAYDRESEVTRLYGVEGTPTQLIIDINGKIRYRGVHVPDDIDEHLPELLTISE